MKKLLSAKHLNALTGRTIDSETLDNTLYSVVENSDYRWLASDINGVQSLMQLDAPTQILSPVVSALLLPLSKRTAKNTVGKSNAILEVLNLGLGGSAIERYFLQDKNTTVISVELSKQVIKLNRQYFHINDDAEPNLTIINQCANQFLSGNQQRFDLITCDIFTGEAQPDFLFDISFYKNLSRALKDSGYIALNLTIANQEQLVTLLNTTQPFFNHRAIVDFYHFKNIVFYLSHTAFNKEKMAMTMNDEMGNEVKQFLVID
ncbi:spermidine synthase [Thalassotalea euphylliae]|uniref:spermidine synthase n=1 Tax=Thalassotalea euphylliae TaxID=1655234 RepID=UPI0036429E5B